MLQSIYTHAGCDHVQVSPPGSRRCFNPHTHAGCDSPKKSGSSTYRPFQSTHPHRVWRVFPAFYSYVLGVSIHTPTQGVTIEKGKRRWNLWFQSTHPRRVWPWSLRCLCNNVLSFNPHTHAGCDTGEPESSFTVKCFNPHTHAGCDNNILYKDILANLFQSTHPRRVWLLFLRFVLKIWKFQSTHPRRVWLNCSKKN